MDKESFYKLLLMLTGGFAAFWILKGQIDNAMTPAVASTSGNSTTFNASGDGEIVTDKDRENAEIVFMAYDMAMQDGETPDALAEINKETLKQYGLRCYATKDGKYVVCNKSGEKVLTV